MSLQIFRFLHVKTIRNGKFDPLKWAKMIGQFWKSEIQHCKNFGTKTFAKIVNLNILKERDLDLRNFLVFQSLKNTILKNSQL